MNRKNYFLAAIALLALARASNGANTCDLSSASGCGAGDNITISITAATCTSGNCEGGCQSGDNLHGAATINVDTNLGCAASRTIAVCQYWVDCTNASVQCWQCNSATYAVGSTPSFSLDCTRGGNGQFYKVIVNDITGSSGSGCTCSSTSSSACSPSSCASNCKNNVTASDHSCCL